MKTFTVRFATCLLACSSLAFSAANAQEPEHAQHTQHEHQGMISMQGTLIVADAPDSAQAIAAAVAGEWRSADNRARDGFRHPAETLAFFGVTPNDTLIEITPGGGWYAEILAPLLREHGHYIAAVVDPATLSAGGGRNFQQGMRDGLEGKFSAAPAQFDRAQILAYDPAAPVLGAPESADVVLTFRNVHNWRMAGQAEGMFRAFYTAPLRTLPMTTAAVMSARHR